MRRASAKGNSEWKRTDRDQTQEHRARKCPGGSCSSRVSGDLTSTRPTPLDSDISVGQHRADRDISSRTIARKIVECRLRSRTIESIGVSRGDSATAIGTIFNGYRCGVARERSRIIPRFAGSLLNSSWTSSADRLRRIIDVPMPRNDPRRPSVVALSDDSCRVPIGELGADACTEDGSKNSRSCVRVEY